MEKNHLMNSLLFDSWKRAGLSEKEAKQAAMESARSDVAMSMVNQSLTRLEAHVDTSMTALRGEMTDLRSHVDTSIAKLDTSMANLRADIIKNANSNSRSDLMIILGAIAVATAVITLF